MKRLIAIISIVLVFTFAYYIYDINKNTKKVEVIEDIKWSLDNTKVALKYKDYYKIQDLNGNIIKEIKDKQIQDKEYNWVLHDKGWEFQQLQYKNIPKDIKKTDKTVQGEFYEKQYNKDGNLIIDKFENNLTIIDLERGEYNILKTIDNTYKADFYYIDKYKSIVKLTKNNIDEIYFVDIKNNIFSDIGNIDINNLEKINLEGNARRIVTDYKYNNFFVLFLDLITKNAVYKAINTDETYLYEKNKTYKIQLPNIYLATIYNDNVYVSSKTGDVYKIYKVDAKNNTYTLLHKSNNMIKDIRIVEGDLYFSELNIINDVGTYKLFKYNGKLQKISGND